MIKATKEQLRDGFVQQFRYLYGLSAKDALAAADEIAADEAVVAAALLCANRSTEIAQKFGWLMPDELKEKSK